jgi:lysyl-tRNA synthetase class 2
VAERAELYFGGVELCNAYGELTDPAEQRRRFMAEAKRRKALGRTVYPLDERFLSALVEGMPPAAGNALGFERLVMVATNRSEI